MSTSAPIRVGILGASGYTGADSARLLLGHPAVEIAALTADRHAGKPMAATFPQFRGYDLPMLTRIEDVDWDGLDAVFCCLPHATTQQAVKDLPRRIKVIDLSADFRLDDPASYAEWYGHEHYAPELQPEAVYGLTEWYREAIKPARLVACPGCYPTAILIALLPLVAAGQIDPLEIIADAKSGATGGGRSVAEAKLFTEVAEGMHPYGVGHHRHMPEMEQELGKAAGRGDIRINFTPHLVPMNRGELVTCHVRLTGGADAEALRATLADRYAGERFIQILAAGDVPHTRYVRGSNQVHIGVFADRIPGRAIVIAAIDNLVKGSAGQAVQNFNLMLGLDEAMGLDLAPLFP